MNVSELIDQLRLLPGEALVVLASDAEGNKFWPLAEVSGRMAYTPETTWNGELSTIDDAEEGFDLSIALWPVN